MIVDITEVIIAPAEDLSDQTRFSAAATGGATFQPVEYHRRAGGFIESSVSVGREEGVDVAATYMDRATFDALAALVGYEILFRDSRGRKMWATLGELAATEHPPEDLLADVSFSLRRVSHVEAV